MSVIGSIIVIGGGLLAGATAVVATLGAGVAALGTMAAGAIGLTGLSSLAVTAIGSGIISGTITAIKGGSLEDVLKSAVITGATSYVGGSVGNYVSKSVTAGLSGSVAPATAKGLGSLAGNVAAGVTRSAIVGQDLQRGAILGVAASTTALLNMSSDFRALPAAVKDVVSVSASTLIRGGDVKEAAVMAAISSGNIMQRALAQSPELKAYMEDPKNKYATEIALTTMNTALAATLIGGDVAKSTEDALVVATIDQMGQAFNEEFTEKVTTAQKKYAKADETQQKLNSNYTKQKEFAVTYEKTYAELTNAEKFQNDAIAKFNAKKSEYDKLNNDGYIEDNQFYISKRTVYENGDVVYSEPTNETEAFNAKVKEVNAAADEANNQIAVAKAAFDAKLPQLQQAEAEIKKLQDAALPLEQVYAADAKEVNDAAIEVTNLGQKFVNNTNKSIISTIYPDFNAKEYSKLNALDDDVDPYTHYVTFGKEENAPINFTDAVSKDFADYGLTVPPSIAKDIVTKIGTSDTPVDALDQYFAERTLTPEEVMVRATKAGLSLTVEEATELAGFGDKAKLSTNLDNYLNIVTRTPGEYTQYGEQLAGLADTIVDGKRVVDVGAVEAKETDPYLFPKDSGATMRVGSGQKASDPYTFTNQLGESFAAVNVTYGDGSVDRIMYEPATDTYKKIQLSSGNKGVGTLPEVGVVGNTNTFTADEIASLTVTERDELLRSSVISKEERAALIAAQKKEFSSDVGQLTPREILELAKQKAIKKANDIKFDAVKEVDKTATPPTDTTTPTTGGTGTDTTTPPTDTGTTTTGGTGTPTTDTTTPTTGGTGTGTPTTGGTGTPTTGGADTTTTTGGTDITSGGTGTPTTGGTDTTTPPPPPPPTDTTTTPKTDTTTPPVDTTTPPTDTTTPPTDTPKPPTDTTKPPTDTTTDGTKPTVPKGDVGDIVKPTADQLRQRQQRTNQLLSLLGAGGGGSGVQQQQVNVKAPELAKINYIYDISGPSIFAVPYNTSLDGTETGTVDDLRKIMKR
jgi:peptidoglycan hydrolase CwlO-like protein